MQISTQKENELPLVQVRRCGLQEVKVRPQIKRFSRAQRQLKRKRKSKGKVVKF